MEGQLASAMATYASQDGGRALCAEAEPIRAAGSVYFRQGHVGVAMNEWMKAIAKLMPVTNSGFSAVEQMVVCLHSNMAQGYIALTV